MKLVKLRFPFFLLVVSFVFFSCTENKENETFLLDEAEPFLPFKTIDLESMSAFEETTDNWRIVGDAYVDVKKEKTIEGTFGTGVLINLPKKGNTNALLTDFEHGDIELELDVMMPVLSEAGLYLQSRYKVQLSDSWGSNELGYSTIGSIIRENENVNEVASTQGYAPQMNASKAPGLWQHLKIIFHAPRFNANGEKVKNAQFEAVWINGQLLHKHQEISSPTADALFTDEKILAPLMFQGNKGPVAFKNIKYKLYGEKEVFLANVNMWEYENESKTIPNLDTLTLLRKIKTDSISSLMASGKRPQKLLKYTGKLLIPEAGEYLFDYRVNNAGGVFLIGTDTIVNLDGEFTSEESGLATIMLSEGEIPFTLIYNKHTPRTRGFSLEIEGPGIQKKSLQAMGSIDLNGGRQIDEIMVNALDGPVTQRSFFMHHNKKRTHVISVGTPDGIHYAYDLAYGSLLKTWDGSFLNTTKMWRLRGMEQLAVPSGFNVSVHGNPDFIFLEDDQKVWPDSISVDMNFRPMGYEFNSKDMPVFEFELNGTLIKDEFIPVTPNRGLQRIVLITGDREIWHKIAEGAKIHRLPDGKYMVENENYFIDFTRDMNHQPIIYHRSGKDELLLKVSSGQQRIKYSIIW